MLSIIDRLEIIENTRQTRRIHLSGGSTYIISLPKNWIDELKIKVGENITIVKKFKSITNSISKRTK